MIECSSKVTFDEIALLALFPATESMHFNLQHKNDITLAEGVEQFLYKGCNTQN
jgi:hypothetical protein